MIDPSRHLLELETLCADVRLIQSAVTAIAMSVASLADQDEVTQKAQVSVTTMHAAARAVEALAEALRTARRAR